MTFTQKYAIQVITAFVGSVLSLFFLSWPEILTFVLIGWVLGGVGLSVALHRYFAHRTFKTNIFWHYVLTFLGLLAGQGSPIGWTATHRPHHALSDTEEDLHSCKHQGRLAVFLFPFLTDPALLNNLSYLRYAQDLMKDPIQKFIFKHYFKIAMVWMLLVLLIDPVLVFPLVFYPIVVAYIGNGLINVNCHWNYKPLNSRLIAFYTWGEGWHEYHHQNPKYYRFPKHPDFGGYVIELIRKRSR